MLFEDNFEKIKSILIQEQIKGNLYYYYFVAQMTIDTKITSTSPSPGIGQIFFGNDVKIEVDNVQEVVMYTNQIDSIPFKYKYCFSLKNRYGAYIGYLYCKN